MLNSIDLDQFVDTTSNGYRFTYVLCILAGILLKPGALLEGKIRITFATSFPVTGWNSNCPLCTRTLEVAETFGSKIQVWSFGQLVGFKTY